ncbi:DUF397 domain-containing protein [Streptomyces sp. NPDC052013]|uniref:DUF397 domain-containing protein n=1 Tax=Streptomyces sp. NPDC052013 TaxID=3365679 RepID=UPI0037CF0037
MRGSSGGECVEVADLAPRVAVRDSKHPAAGVFTVSPPPSRRSSQLPLNSDSAEPSGHSRRRHAGRRVCARGEG